MSEIHRAGQTGSALGSVSAAVVLSTLGAAGTLIGAALGSLFITVGGTFYSHTLRRAKSGIVKVAEKVTPAPRTSRTASGAAPRDDATSATVADDAANASNAAPEPPKPSWRQTLRSLPWKRIAWLTGGLFAVTIVVILAFELTTGRPVSSYTGGTSSSDTGTSFSGWTSRNDDDQQQVPGQQEDFEQQQPDVTDRDEEPASDEPAPAPTAQEPEQEPQPEQAPEPEQEAPPQQEQVEAPQ